MWGSAYIIGYVAFLTLFIVQHDKLVEIITDPSINPFHLPMWVTDFIAAVITAIWPVTLVYLVLKRFGQRKGE